MGDKSGKFLVQGFRIEIHIFELQLFIIKKIMINFLLSLTLVAICFSGLSQSSETIITEKNNEIIRDTDSLSKVLESTIQNRESKSMSTKLKIENIKENTNYEHLLSKKILLDSSITNLNVEINVLDKIAQKDNLIDSLMSKHPLTLYKSWSNTKTSVIIENFINSTNYKKLKNADFDISSREFNGFVEELKDYLYKCYMELYNRSYLHYFEQSSILKNELLFNINLSYKESKSIKKMLGQFDCSWDASYLIVSASSYNKLKLMGNTSDCYTKKPNMENIDEDEYIVISIEEDDNNEWYNSRQNTPKGVVISMTFSDYSPHKFIQSKPMNEKKLEKIKEKLAKSGIVFLDSKAKNSFWNSYGYEILLFKRHLNAIEDIKRHKIVMDSMNLELSKVINTIRDTENEISRIEKEFDRELRNLKYSIDKLERRISDKENRIQTVKDNESKRVKLIADADSLMQIKNYEIAISKYKKAQELYNHPDVTPKLDRATELYAPILEKKKEEETLARLERERIAREEAERRERELPQTAFNHLKGYLKSPYTASLNQYAINKINGCRTVVTLEVDSQNAFGAYIRGSFNVFFANGRPCYAKEGGLTEVSLLKNDYQGYSSLQESELTGVGCGCR